MGLEEEKNNTIKDEITEDQEITEELEITEDQEILEEPKEPEEPEITEDQEIIEDQSDISENPPINTPENLQPEENFSNSELIEQELLEFADFDSLEDLSEDDLADMMEAIEENKDQQLTELDNQAIDGQEIIEQEKPEFKPEIDAELEAKMQAELELKKKSRGIKETTREDLIEYL
ncbi:MAG: hypothetical protein ACTSRX_09490, partial [Promethearchaeota archaeon]